MLPKTYRLPSREKLLHPKQYRFPLFVIKTASNQLGMSRIGVVVSKKVDKRAVVRNMLKRQVRAAFSGSEFLKKGVDVLCIVQKDAVKAPQGSLQKAMKEFIEQL